MRKCLPRSLLAVFMESAESAQTIFDNNIAALRLWNAAGADLLTNAVVDAGWKPVLGRDGTATFRRPVPGDTTRVEWLGGTGSPRATAAAMVAHSEPGTGNALGLGLGAGFPWPALLKRMAPQQVLFVWEPQIDLARLALQVCDLREVIAAGRLIVMVGANPRDQYAAVLATHPGIDAADVLHPLPSLSTEQRNSAFRAAEPMVRAAMEERMAAIAEAAEDCEKIYRESAPAKSGRGLVLAAQGGAPAGYSLINIVGAVRRAAPSADAAKMHGETAIASIALDSPLCTSPLLWLQTIARRRPDWIAANAFRWQLGNGIPDKLLVETWIPPTVASEFWRKDRFGTPARLGPYDRVVCHFAQHMELIKQRLDEHGLAAERLELRPLPMLNPANPAAYVGGDRVAIFGDVPRYDAASLGWTLPSHGAVWKAAQWIIEQNPLAADDAAVEKLLTQAQRQVAVELNDAAVLEDMRFALRHMLLPGAMLAGLARLLEKTGQALICVGAGWERLELKNAVLMACDAAPASWISDAALAVHANPAGIFSPLVLIAAGAGVPMVAAQNARDAMSGGLKTFFDKTAGPQAQMLLCAPERLSATVGRLMSDAPARAAMGRRGREKLLRHCDAQSPPTLPDTAAAASAAARS